MRRITPATYDIFVGLERLDEGGRHVVDSEDDLSDACFGQSLDLVAQNGFVAEEDEWLGDGECQGAQTSAVAANQDKSLHY